MSFGITGSGFIVLDVLQRRPLDTNTNGTDCAETSQLSATSR